MEAQTYIVLILFILLFCWLFGSSSSSSLSSSSFGGGLRKRQSSILRADPPVVVAPIRSINTIRSKLQDFILINLPFDQSASQTYPECTSDEHERSCPKQGGIFLVEYASGSASGSASVARFTSFVSQMDDYHTLVASGVPTMIIALPSSAQYMGEIKLTA